MRLACTPVQRQLVDTGTGASNNDTQRLASTWGFPAPETVSRCPRCEGEMGEMGVVVTAAKRAVLDALAATIASRQRDNNGAT
jgi:hypothetical protein